MAPVYGVTYQHVAAEVPGLFPGGFTQATPPTAEQVTAWIAAADALVALTVRGTTGLAPDPATDPSADLARQFIRSWVLAYVMRTVYAGRASSEIESAARPYVDVAAQLLDSIKAMGAQAVGTGAATARVRGEDGTRVRDMLVDDADLDAGRSGGSCGYSPYAGPPFPSSRRGRY